MLWGHNSLEGADGARSQPVVDKPDEDAKERQHAGVAELVDAPDSKSGSARSVGSSPTTGTTFHLSLK